jgi:hypothetical protein
MSGEVNKVLVETVVCGGAEGKGARFLRMIERRQSYKRRQEGCLAAWSGQSIDGSGLMLVQTAFSDQESWKRISEDVVKTLDSKDGGLESVLAGPPLVGMFEISADDLHLLENKE